MEIRTATVLVALLMVGAAVPTATAHNFFGVHDATLHEYVDRSGDVSYNVWHCDNRISFPCYNAQGESPIQGFAFLDGEDLLIHMFCRVSVRDASVDALILPNVWIPSVERDDELSDDDRCNTLVSQGGTGSRSVEAHTAFNVPHGETMTEVQAYGTIDVVSVTAPIPTRKT